MGKHLSFWIGFFAAALLVVPVALGVMGVAEQRLRDLAVAAFAGVAALVVLLVIALFFRDRILRRVLGRSEVALEDVAGSLVGAVSAASEGDRDKAAAHARALVQGGVGWYTWSSFYRWVIGSALGLLLAFGAFVGTVLLFEQTRTLRVQTERIGEQTELMKAQTERLREQTEAAAVQNEIMTLGIVSDLRTRLLASARRLSLDDAMRGASYRLPPDARLQNAGRTCELYLNVDTTLTRPPNGATLAAVTALAQKSRLAEQVREALFFLLRDDEPAVVLGAVLVLNALDIEPPPDVIRMDRVVVDLLELNHSWNLQITNSIVQALRCDRCSVSIRQSLVHINKPFGFRGNFNFEIYGTHPFYRSYASLQSMDVLSLLANSIIANEVEDIGPEYLLLLPTVNSATRDMRPFLNPLAHWMIDPAADGMIGLEPISGVSDQCIALQIFANGTDLFLFRNLAGESGRTRGGAVLDF